MNALRSTRSGLLIGLVFLFGCGGSDGPPLGHVSGVVTRGNVPLKGATVLFKAQGAPGSIGVTDAEGRYTLKYIGREAGAVVGRNTVTVFVPNEAAASEEGEGMRKLFEETREVTSRSQTIDIAITGIDCREDS